MEFWPENQGQSPLYSKFGTVPGRNCAHNYHDRHQAAHYPLYYGEQQDQGRESSYWTVPGSRTGGAPQEYTNWTDQDLTVPTSSHFPFILDRHAQQHQDLGDYQPHDVRDREWTAAQRAAREYERGFLREAWQRRWEPCSPVRYNREVSTKRSDSSYRELEAWAARYSHSLPRRRRIEAELRGASQGLLESSRAPEREVRSGTDPRVAALQQVLQSANIRESGLWDRGGRQQAPTYYPSQTPATDTSHMLDMKEKIGYQRRMFSQPPGYIAPPPYNSPHKSSPVLHHCDTSWEQEGKRQTYWPQATLRKQDVSLDLQDHRKGETVDFSKPDGNQKPFPELEGLKHRRQETDALQATSPTSIPKTPIQHERTTSLQPPQVLQAVQNKVVHEEPSSKVIEGRKFRLNKKTGGMTIFCLVSRIAGTPETPSLPLCTSNTNTQNTELGEVSIGPRDSGDINQTHKLADEVDFRVSTLTEQPNTSDARNLNAQQTIIESDQDNLPNKAETEKENTNDTDSTFGRQVAQPASVKYPLWREPSFSSRAEAESSSTCLRANTEDGEPDDLHSKEDSAKVHPIDVEVRRLDIKKDTESEDSSGLLVIDTTCVVVKMELIQSPKKEHVHYFDSTSYTEPSPLDVRESQLNQEETNPLHMNERPETELDLVVMDKKAPEEESKICFPCMSSSSASERETLEERAERILGIPLHDCFTKQRPEEDATSLLDSCVEDQEEPSTIKDNNSDDATELVPKDTEEEEQSLDQLEVGQKDEAAHLQENDEATDQVVDDFAGPQEQELNMSEENDNDSQLETDINASLETEMTEHPRLNSTCEEGTTEQSQEEDQPLENDPSQCLNPSPDLSNSSWPPPSLDCEAPNPVLSSNLTSLLYISESSTEEGPDPELIALNSAQNLAPYPETSSLSHTPSEQLPSPLPPGSTDLHRSSTPPTDHSPSPSPLDLIDQTVEAVSGAEDRDETSQLTNSEISDILAKDMIEELVLQQQCESGQPDDAACVKESNITDEQQTKEADEDHTENAVEVITLQRQLGCVKAEDVACTKVSYITEEQLPKEADEDPTGLLDQTMSQENVTDCQTEVDILQQQFDMGQEEDASGLKESYMTEEQSQKEADEVPTGVVEQIQSKQEATDSQTQIEIQPLQDIEPQTEPSDSTPPTLLDSDCHAFKPPLDELSPSELPSPPHNLHKSVTELVPPLEMDSLCPSALNPNTASVAGVPETILPPIHSKSCDESIQFSSSSDSPCVLLPSSSTPPPQQGSPSVSLDSPLKDEPQYPKSLWDAVNRIRKHTAPDSENEEEEVCELWDPESVGDDSGFLDVVEDISSERIAGQQEISTEGSIDVEVGQVQQYPCHEELSGHVEEDTLSCSSASSHGSGDTVIIADEDEVEEMPPDAGTESKTEKEFEAAERERCCSGEVKDETAAEEEEDDGKESVTEEGPAEVENIRNDRNRAKRK